MEKTIFTLTKEKINSYEKSIGELKARITKEKKGNLANYEKKLAELEHKTSELKKKLEEFKEEGKEKWDSFKLKFNRDMDELGKALKNFTVKSK